MILNTNLPMLVFLNLKADSKYILFQMLGRGSELSCNREITIPHPSIRMITINHLAKCAMFVLSSSFSFISWSFSSKSSIKILEWSVYSNYYTCTWHCNYMYVNNYTIHVEYQMICTSYHSVAVQGRETIVSVVVRSLNAKDWCCDPTLSTSVDHDLPVRWVMFPLCVDVLGHHH